MFEQHIKTSKINIVCVKRRERKAPYNPYPNAVAVARGARLGRLLKARGGIIDVIFITKLPPVTTLCTNGFVSEAQVFKVSILGQ